MIWRSLRATAAVSLLFTVLCSVTRSVNADKRPDTFAHAGRLLRISQASIGKRSTSPPPAVGLPHDCLNYADRYRREYYRGLHDSNGANALHKDSQFLVVLLLHNLKKKGEMPLDAVLNMRALAHEVTQAGYHFLILFQVPRRTYYQVVDAQDAPADFNHEHMLQLLPHDLRPFVVPHDFEEDFESYPLLGIHDNPHMPASGWGVGPRASYTAMTRLMQRYKGYKWAWSIESDVRWTGANWGHFLNAALSLGIQAAPEQLSADPLRWIETERLASRNLPVSLDGLPDLLTFAPIYKSEKWRKLAHNMHNASILYDTMATIYGASRQFYDRAHEYCKAGVGSHLEVFLPTVAVHNGMKAGGLKVERHPALPASWHCCTEHGALAYADFHNRTACSTGLLLHPVKNLEEFWPPVA